MESEDNALEMIRKSIGNLLEIIFGNPLKIHWKSLDLFKDPKKPVVNSLEILLEILPNFLWRPATCFGGLLPLFSFILIRGFDNKLYFIFM